jgi:hypothetical protein
MTTELLGEVTPIQAEVPHPEPSATTETPETQDDGQEPQKPDVPDPAAKGVQKRINELTWEREEAKRQAQAAYSQAQQYEAQLRQMQMQMQAVQKLQNLPDPAQFADPYQYQEAVRQQLAQSEVQSLQNAQAELHRQQQTAMQLQYAQAEAIAVSNVRAQGSEKYPDFNEVINNQALPDFTTVAPAFKQVLFSMPEAADVVYYLAKNPTEAFQLMAMPVPHAIAQLGNIKAQLSAQPKKPSQQPIQTITGGGGFKPGLSDELPINEWMKRREAQLRKRS